MTVHLKTVDDPNDDPNRFQSLFSPVIMVDAYIQTSESLTRHSFSLNWPFERNWKNDFSILFLLNIKPNKSENLEKLAYYYLSIKWSKTQIMIWYFAEVGFFKTLRNEIKFLYTVIVGEEPLSRYKIQWNIMGGKSEGKFENF